MNGPRVWLVFVAYGMAFVTIVVFSFVAALAIKSLYPDMPADELFGSLPGLLAGGVASSAALLVTLVTVARPADLTRLRLRPGREQGRHLAAMIVGVVALSQALDSLTVLAGLGEHGANAWILRALGHVRGPGLFAAVVIIGVVAGAVEELFFRAYMQTELATRWGGRIAVLVTSACFGLLHLELLHTALAFCLGLYLGFITERAGSALPAIACHIINNVLFTVLAAAFGATGRAEFHGVLLTGAVVLTVVCVVYLVRALPAR